MISVCIRNTFLHFGVDAPAEVCLELRRAASDPLSRGGCCERLLTCSRASQDSEENENFSCEVGGSYDENASPDCDGGLACGAITVGASQTGTSPSSAGRTLLGRERDGIRVECKGCDQVGQDCSVTMWKKSQPKETDAIKAIRAAAPPAGNRWSKRAYRELARGQEHERTTVMLRNLPLHLSREGLVATLASRGFGEKVNFLYMPFDLQTCEALGYAFVNLQTPADAAFMMRSLKGFSAWPAKTSKRCSVSWSRPLQGLDAHVAEYRNSPLMHTTVPESCRPMLFEDGKRISFPPPTKRLKPPRRGTQMVLV